MEHVNVIGTRDVAVSEVSPHPQNANKGNKAEIARRLREMGQYRTIVVHQPTGYILAGNTVYAAATDELGWTHIRAEFVDCTEARALEILAWDNRARDLSLGNDQESLFALLSEIEAHGDLTTAGYDGADLDDLRAALEEIGQPIEVPVPDPIAVDPRKTIDQMGEQYEQAKTRMVMLMFSNPEYVWVVERLQELAEQWEFDNSPDVLKKLLADATGQPLPEVAE